MRDVDVRRGLHQQLSVEHADDPDTMILDELAVRNGRARVDVAVVNGQLTGYEIKSNVDKLDRLPGQAEVYGQVFDELWIVAGQRHLDQAKSIVPSWWGIYVATIGTGDRRAHLELVRPANRNTTAQDSTAVAQLLWRDEAIELLAEFEIGNSELRRGSRRHMYVALAAAVPFEVLKARVRASLKARAGWRS